MGKVIDQQNCCSKLIWYPFYIKTNWNPENFSHANVCLFAVVCVHKNYVLTSERTCHPSEWKFVHYLYATSISSTLKNYSKFCQAEKSAYLECKVTCLRLVIAELSLFRRNNSAFCEILWPMTRKTCFIVTHQKKRPQLQQMKKKTRCNETFQSHTRCYVPDGYQSNAQFYCNCLAFDIIPLLSLSYD